MRLVYEAVSHELVNSEQIVKIKEAASIAVVIHNSFTITSQ